MDPSHSIKLMKLRKRNFQGINWYFDHFVLKNNEHSKSNFGNHVNY